MTGMAGPVAGRSPQSTAGRGGWWWHTATAYSWLAAQTVTGSAAAAASKPQVQTTLKSQMQTESQVQVQRKSAGVPQVQARRLAATVSVPQEPGEKTGDMRTKPERRRT